MDFDPAYRRHKVHTFRTQKQEEREKQIKHKESAITAPYKSFPGLTLHIGGALSNEIENYRRCVIALLNFLDSVAYSWWDKLYSFNEKLVKRPSKSAEMIVELRMRLKAKLERLTPRMVTPAAAAIIAVEEQETIPVLPSNFLQRSNRRNILFRIGNVQEILNLAYSIARRLGEVERLKQQLILYTEEWINSDGRDFALRAQRLVLLAKNVKGCLVERFKGVQAIIIHYYRQRSSNSQVKMDNKLPVGVKPDPKTRLANAFTEVTAESFSSTNDEIFRILREADQTLTTDLNFTNNYIHTYMSKNFPVAKFSINSVESYEESTFLGDYLKPLEVRVDNLSLSSIVQGQFGFQQHNEAGNISSPTESKEKGNLAECDKDVSERSQGMPEIISYTQRNSCSEPRKSREQGHLINKILATSKPKASTNENGIPNLENTGSKITLFRLSSSFEDDQNTSLTQSDSEVSHDEKNPREPT
ncbi:unnamed protein product [Hymenolepis diminuta]|uniref:DUF5738 domain-containing protein n=1 Tax=Hymenolepis diminuta TaxID=6216 RepID=A0A564YIY2_HYMDI|nr:unnamed protein product [Hymenolepis diminuta]